VCGGFGWGVWGEWGLESVRNGQADVGCLRIQGQHRQPGAAAAHSSSRGCCSAQQQRAHSGSAQQLFAHLVDENGARDAAPPREARLVDRNVVAHGHHLHLQALRLGLLRGQAKVQAVACACAHEWSKEWRQAGYCIQWYLQGQSAGGRLHVCTRGQRSGGRVFTSAQAVASLRKT